MNNNKAIVECDVSNCIFNNIEEGNCTLENLNISSACDGSVCDDSYSTICQSFESSGGIITDNEYEISSEFDPGYNYLNEEEKEAF